MEDYIRILKNGGVIAAPTDTVYGLLADATNPDAVEKVYTIKGRGEDKALPIFIPSLDTLKDIALVTEAYLAWLKTLWPGKVTFVFNSKPDTPLAPNAIAKDKTVALRIPNHPLILDILKQYNKPLTGTSANRSGEPSCLDTYCIETQLRLALPDAIIDGGTLRPSEASTIADLTKTPPTIVRKGADYEKVLRLVQEAE